MQVFEEADEAWPGPGPENSGKVLYLLHFRKPYAGGRSTCAADHSLHHPKPNPRPAAADATKHWKKGMHGAQGASFWLSFSYDEPMPLLNTAEKPSYR